MNTPFQKQLLEVVKGFDAVAKTMMPIQDARPAPSVNRIVTWPQPVFVMVPPSYVSNKVKNNAAMTDPTPYDLPKAYSQFKDVLNQLAPQALVYLLPEQNDLQDQVYVSNLFATLPHLEKPTAILSNYRSQVRAAEEDIGRAFLSMLEFDVIQSPFFFEGAAEIKHIKDNLYFGGYNIRTAIETYDWMTEKFQMDIVRIKMIDAELYHFDTVFFPIDSENAIVAVENMEKPDVKQIEDRMNIIPISFDVAHRGATNCVRCKGQVLCGSNITELSVDDADYEAEKAKVDLLGDTMARMGLDFVTLNISEFAKSGADLSCMVGILKP